MPDDTVPDAVIELVRAVAAHPDVPLTPRTRFDEIPEWSSLRALRLLAAVESRFTTRLDLRTFTAAVDIGALAALVAPGARDGGAPY